MKRISLLTFTITLILFLACDAYAVICDPLGTYNWTSGGASRTVYTDVLDLDVGIEEEDGDPYANAVLWDADTFGASASGQKYCLSSGSAYTNFLNFLQNGEDDYVLVMSWWPSGGGGSTGFLESQHFAGPNGVDLEDCYINAICLDFVDFTIEHDTPEGYATDYSFEANLIIYGSCDGPCQRPIPEPTTVILLGLGAVGILKRKML